MCLFRQILGGVLLGALAYGILFHMVRDLGWRTIVWIWSRTIVCVAAVFIAIWLLDC